MNDRNKNILKKIINANNESKLVLFVGSGVSRNSGIPGWGDLVKQMGKKLKINVDNLNSDDYLTIPQMLFNQNPDEYKNVLNEVLNNDYETNQIDDLIVKLQPDQIITTNYDNLIEQSLNNLDSKKDYKVIYDDSSFIKNSSKTSNFIIKMHGDINDPDSIVLKDKDYLDYEDKHILISNLIKTLLATHIFLFVGYSISDNNLKLIINWFNNIKNKLSIEDKDNNILFINLSDKDRYGYEIQSKYFQNNSIDLFSLKDTKELITQYGNKCNINGKNKKYALPIYSALRYLYEGDYLESSLKRLNDLKYISYHDIMNIIIPFFQKIDHPTCYYIDNYIILDFDTFSNLQNAIELSNTLSKLLKSVFEKSPITNIINNKNDKRLNFINNYEDEIYTNIVNNNYDFLLENISNDYFKKYDLVYLYNLFSIKKNNWLSVNDKFIDKLRDNLNEITFDKNTNYIRYVINKFNVLTFEIKNVFNVNETPVQSKYTKYLKNIFKGRIYTKFKVESDSIKKQEDIYSGHLHIGYSVYGNCIKNYGELNNAKDVVYDYYSYMIKNRIFNRYNNKEIFNNFLELIFITYTSKDNFGYEKNYKIEPIDIDIISKNMKLSDLKEIFNKYNIYEVYFSNYKKTLKMFFNLCRSYKYIIDNDVNDSIIVNFDDYISKYLLFLSYCRDLSDSELTKIYKILFYNIFKLRTLDMNQTLLVLINYFIPNQFSKNELTNSDLLLIENISDLNIYKCIDKKYHQNIDNIFLNENMCKIVPIKVKKIINKNMLSKSTKYNYVYNFHNFISIKYFNDIFSKSVIDQYCNGDVYKLWILYIDGYIYGDKVNYMFNSIVNTIYKDDLSIYSWPDYRSARLIVIMQMVSNGYKFDKNIIKNITNKSPILQFLYDSKNFDYSKINLNDDIWKGPIMFDLVQNNNKFLNDLKNNKYLIFNDQLKTDAYYRDISLEIVYILTNIGIDIYKESLNN